MIVPALFVGALFLVVFLRQPPGPVSREQWIFSGQALGTGFTVKVVVPDEPAPDKEEVSAAIRAALEEVDAAMSTYRPESELSRFNDHGTEAFAVSLGMMDVFVEAQRVAELSNGAFDITIGPLVDAWGFGPEVISEPPDDEEIGRLLKDNGYRRLEIDTGAGTLRKDRAGLRCDLSAIAKGFAVDRVSERLSALGFADHMVEVGGEVRTAGSNAGSRPWRIGVERPQGERGELWSAVELRDVAMATSGDYRNYYERDGVRISHLLDPRTGHPICHNLASVTVIHPSCMTADALATALSVLGPVDGRALVERERLAVLFLVRNPDGGFDEWKSPAWPVENTSVDGKVTYKESR